MYVTRVELENVRGFLDGDAATSLDLARADGTYAGWTVFAGRNGSGKSTFLRAVALAIAGPEFSRQFIPSFRGWIREGEREARVRVHLLRHEFDSLQGTGKPPKKPFSAELKWIVDPTAPGGEPILTNAPERQKKLIGPWRGPWAENPQGWFIAGYGPFRRLTGHASDAQRMMVGPHHVRRMVSLFREDASLTEAIEWIQSVRFKALEQRSGADALFTSLLDLLNDGLLPDNAKITGVDSDGLWVTRNGTRVRLVDLSDGYRVVIALLVDILRGMHECYGTLDIRKSGKTLQVRMPGVVIVDEMDAHMHVEWQRRIGFWLCERFPEVQFLVSTHSPFTCQAAGSNGLIKLPVPGEQLGARHVDAQTFKRVVNGTVSDAVLSQLFGLERTRSERADRLVDEYSRLRAREVRSVASPSDKSRISQLKEQLPLPLDSNT